MPYFSYEMRRISSIYCIFAKNLLKEVDVEPKNNNYATQF